MNSIDRKLAELLAVVPLLEAEKITGVSYKESDATSALGLLINLENHASREALLTLANDTCFSNTVEDYTRKIKEEGFSQVLLVPFTIAINYNGELLPVAEHRDERFFVFWHLDGILLCFDTIDGDKVNSAKFYYNFAVSDYHKFYEARESGCFITDSVWGGDHDGREAVRFHLRQMRACGRFLPQWIERPHLWLVHYGDTRGKEYGEYDSDAINEARIAMLPEHVRNAITPTGK